MNFHSPCARCLMQRTPDILVHLSTFVGYFCVVRFILSWPVQAKSDRLLEPSNEDLNLIRYSHNLARSPERKSENMGILLSLSAIQA